MIDGSIFIGFSDRRNANIFRAINPVTGENIGPSVSEAGDADVADACALSAEAYPAFSTLSPAKRSDFLEAVATAIESIGDTLIETAMSETGLPRVRLEGERGRTCGQLRLFAAELQRGVFLDVTIDSALPDRVPPRPDIRRMNVALGPVAVFGASNFPLAFSVAGGDTASAWAAGCPVVVKGHPAHPGTGELVARAIRAAVQQCGLPEGVFSFLPGRGNALGAALVSDARIKAVGFTGSRSGGLALTAIASQRPEPIPVYAEMSSINPIILLPAALASGATALAEAFIGSLTLGAGQFCTNPGLVLAIDSFELDAFLAATAASLSKVDPPVMLTPGIHEAFVGAVAERDGNSASMRVATGATSAAPNRCTGALFTTSADAFLRDSTFGAEIFGASALIVRCRTLEEMGVIIRRLEGQLTITLHSGAGDEAAAAELLPLVQERAGRVLFNGWPTGVEVCHAMVHGGPFPATSDGRTTSVGTLAIMRFLRPSCLQNVPVALLPPALQDANPWALPRTMDGVMEARL